MDAQQTWDELTVSATVSAAATTTATSVAAATKATTAAGAIRSLVDADGTAVEPAMGSALKYGVLAVMKTARMAWGCLVAAYSTLFMA